MDTMKSMLNILDRELTFWNLEANTDLEAIAFLADELVRQGVVKESFKSAVLEREQTAPTGLQTEKIGIAMPHTTEEHVIRKGLAAGFFCSPVPFRAMGMPETEVKTQIVFLLALTDPHGHLDLLQELAAAFENPDILTAMLEAGDFDKLTDLIKSLP
jgi:PTS system galactitol-specific IIA component